jgi:hypothetical protein
LRQIKVFALNTSFENDAEMTGANSADRRFEKGFCIEEIRQCGPHGEQAEPGDSQQSPKAETRVDVTRLFSEDPPDALAASDADPRRIRDLETIYKDPTGSQDPIETSGVDQKMSTVGFLPVSQAAGRDA